MQGLWTDLRHAVRALAKNPGVAALAILTLALGAGADTAIFSIVQGALLRPFPYRDPERIVWQDHSVPQQGLEGLPLSYPNYVDLRDRSHLLEEMVAWRYANFNLAGDQEAERVEGIRVTANLFSMLGVRPAEGREFLAEEDRPGGNRVAVIGQGLWRRRFGGRREALGSQLLIDGEAHTIVGVMPADFAFPEIAEVWIPLALDAARAPRDRRMLYTIARLKPGATMAQARAGAAAVMRGLEREYPTANTGLALRLIPMRDFYLQNTRAAILLALGAAAFLMMIACANVANLLLARATARQKEMAVRAALGAGRWRLARQALAEGVLLSAVAGALGCYLAFWLLHFIVAQIPLALPFWLKLRIDGASLWFALSIAVATGLLFAAAPAAASWKTDLQEALKESVRGASGSRGQNRLRQLLVASETALAVVLLAGASLMVRSFLSLASDNLGFRTRGTLAVDVQLPAAKYGPTDEVAFYDALEQRAGRLPGVRSAALAWELPLRRAASATLFTIEGRPAVVAAEVPMAAYRVVSASYFRTLGMRLERGRLLEERDGPNAQPVAVISRTMAQRFWPGEDPVGRRFKLGRPEESAAWREIVGVVADVRNNWFGADLRSTIYVPYRQEPRAGMSLLVAAESGAEGVVAGVRAEISALDRSLPVVRVTTMDRVVADSMWRNRLFAIVFAVFAVVALVLSAGGLYGVISYSASLRTREIGIRAAMGAGRSEIVRLIVCQGMRVALAGALAGLAAAAALTRLLSGLLFEVRPGDPLTLAAATGLVAMTALAACYVPAVRATRIDPLEALRHE